MSFKQHLVVVFWALAATTFSNHTTAQTAQVSSTDNTATQTSSTISSAAEDAEKNTAVPLPQEVIFDTVKQKAQRLVKEEFVQDSTEVPKELANLNYDQYRAIRFNPESAFWRGISNFEIQLFHPGFIFTKPVKLYTVSSEGSILSHRFLTEEFIYDKPAEFLKGKKFENAGFSGFRIHFPLNSGDYKDEVLAFQGASYFRLLSSGQTFGLSARGIAIDTAEASGEEFPYFTEFWLLTPTPGDTDLYVFALLESPSLTGAYRFKLTPGLPSELKVDLTLYAREDVKKLGIAPLTSMFMMGENSVRRFDDMRPEVHDSDGLLMQTHTDEWIWRPLANPPHLRTVGLSDVNPKGFGLLQRDNNFDHYQDIGATYQTRPGMWVSPIGDWGPGHVELVEIPSPSETNDNIVAYWVSDSKLNKGETFSTSYVLSSVTEAFGANDLAKVTRTGNALSELPGMREKISKYSRRFSIDFSGRNINLLAESVPLMAEVQSSDGRVSDINVNKLPTNDGWRVSFKLDDNEQNSADMRVYLSLRGERVSEVWNYVWSPKSLP